MEEPRCIPTKNNKGFQTSTPCPLLDDWLNAYDNQHPLLDIGCAYGINTFEALKRGIPTIAIDCEQKHLDILRTKANEKGFRLLTTRFGRLPHEIPVEDKSVSAILLSEVLHFLTGDEIRETLQKMFHKLCDGGILVIAMASINIWKDIDDELINRFFRDLSTGNPWPGLTHVDDSLIKKVATSAQKRGINFTLDPLSDAYVQYCIPEQLTNELIKTGYHILKAAEAQHPGYIEAMISPECNVQIVAQKCAKRVK